ncbi:hypothetical protein BJ742DRAFT_800968 [Cladochytrium replicatum]|nr:hypothetical protein BJ742DRAFT_800968 [Cladochytrium replicatum]
MKDETSQKCGDLESQVGKGDSAPHQSLDDVLPPYENIATELPADALHGNPQRCSPLLEPISRYILVTSATLIMLSALYSMPRSTRLAEHAFPQFWQRRIFDCIMVGYYTMMVCAPVMLLKARTYGDALRITLGPIFLGLMAMCMLAGAGWKLYGWRQG